jgi:hypothetical protein
MDAVPSLWNDRDSAHEDGELHQLEQLGNGSTMRLQRGCRCHPLRRVRSCADLKTQNLPCQDTCCIVTGWCGSRDAAVLRYRLCHLEGLKLQHHSPAEHCAAWVIYPAKPAALHSIAFKLLIVQLGPNMVIQ